MISKQAIAEILNDESFKEVMDNIIQDHLNVITYSNDDEVCKYCRSDFIIL